MHASNPRSITILILITLFQLHSEVLGGHYPQYGIFYEQPGCFGEGYEYTFESVYNATGLIANPTSFGFRGAWIHYERMKNNTDRHVTSFYTDPEGNLCSEQSTPPRETIYSMKVIDSDLDDSAIAFFNKYYDEADVAARVQSNETEFYLSKPTNFTTIVFTGLNDYTVYSESNFTGTEICVMIYENNGRYGLTDYQLLQPIVVGSVRLGCSGSQHFTIQKEITGNVDGDDDAVEIFPPGRSEINSQVDAESGVVISKKGNARKTFKSHTGHKLRNNFWTSR